MPTRNGITLIRESRPLARSPHTCTCCLQSIAIGERYACVVVRDNERKDKNRNLLCFRWHLPLCPRELRCDPQPVRSEIGGAP